MIIKGPVVASCWGRSIDWAGGVLLTVKQITSVNVEVLTHVCEGLISFEAECT